MYIDLFWGLRNQTKNQIMHLFFAERTGHLYAISNKRSRSESTGTSNQGPSMRPEKWKHTLGETTDQDLRCLVIRLCMRAIP